MSPYRLTPAFSYKIMKGILHAGKKVVIKDRQGCHVLVKGSGVNTWYDQEDLEKVY